MKVYKLFPNVAAATQAIADIDARMGFNILNPNTITWGHAIEHPCASDALIPYDPVRLAACSEAFVNVRELNEEQAIQAGWYLGYFRGRYAKAKGKVEEIQYLFDTLRAEYGYKPFPYIKALLFGFTSGCYSIKETLRKLSSPNSCNKATRAHEEWWQQKFNAEINREGELLQYFYRMNNADKHNFQVPLRSIGCYSSDRGMLVATGAEWLATDDGARYLGSEGFFDSVEPEKGGLRRIVGDASVLAGSYQIHSARWTVEFLALPMRHLGAPIPSSAFLDVISTVLDYYTNLVIEADRRFG